MKLNGAMIRNGRHRKGLTQEELGQILDLSAVTIGRAEKGEPVWPGTGKAICEFLGVDLEKAVVSEQENGNAA